MKNLLTLSINSILLFISSLLIGCSPSPKEKSFVPKSINEYYTILENTTIETDLFVDNKRASCFFSNDSNLYVCTIKRQHSKDFGCIYNKKTNQMYDIENCDLIETSLNKNPIDIITELLGNTNFLFHLNYDYGKFSYKNEEIVCERLCDVYRFTDKIKDQEAVFNIYIDQETGLCLKAVCSIENQTYIYFVVKKFEKKPAVETYYTQINELENYKEK